jgi:hypothetical protein
MILYAGEIAAELRTKEHLMKFYANRKVALFGSEDKIIPIEIVQDVEPMLIQNGFEVSIYQGGHTILRDAVLSTFSV